MTTPRGMMYAEYTRFLKKLFAVEDQYKIHVSAGLPRLDELYDREGNAKSEEYMNENVGRVITERKSLIMKALDTDDNLKKNSELIAELLS